MSVPIEWSSYEPFPEGLEAELDQYNTDVGALETGDMTPAETVQATVMLNALKEQVQDAVKWAQKRGEAAMELKAVLIKWASYPMKFRDTLCVFSARWGYLNFHIN